MLLFKDIWKHINCAAKEKKTITYNYHEIPISYNFVSKSSYLMRSALKYIFFIRLMEIQFLSLSGEEVVVGGTGL